MTPALRDASRLARRTFSISRPLVRRLVSRRRVDDILDTLRFRLDTFPDGAYQPVPGLADTPSMRSEGSRSRWDAMRPVIERSDVRSAVDIGANVGYFSLALASLGIPTVAVERDPASVRTLLFAARRSNARNVGVLALDVDPATVGLIPRADCVLFLSLWHHLARRHGLEHATEMLKAIWDRTERVLFFESPRPSSTAAAPSEWFTRYLGEHCAGGRVEHLGRHPASEGNPIPRDLFAIVRGA